MWTWTCDARTRIAVRVAMDIGAPKGAWIVAAQQLSVERWGSFRTGALRRGAPLRCTTVCVLR